MRVLLAEDNAAVLKMLTAILEGAGLQVETTGDGNAAQRALQLGQFDLVLIDSRLPGQDGPELARTLRAEAGEAGSVAMIGLVPAGDDTGEAERCMAAGMTGVLVKPVFREQLLEAIERIARPGDESGPAIDLEHLNRYTDGDAALEMELLDLFVQGATDYLATLGAADTDKAWSVAAHSLKGSARGIGATEVASLAEAAERLTGAATEGRTAQLAALHTAVARVTDFVAVRRSTQRA